MNGKARIYGSILVFSSQAGNLASLSTVKQEEDEMRLNFWTAAFLLMATVFVVGCGETATQDKKEVSETKSKAKIPDYEVAKTEPRHVEGSKRFNWHVVVDGPVTPEQLEAVAEELVMKAKSDKEFEAATIMFYDFPEYVGDDATLGVSSFALIRVGDDETDNFIHNLQKKDWSKRLTKEEVAIWKAFVDKINKAKEDPTRAVPEREITEEVAAEMDTTYDAVGEILLKQAAWKFLDE